jgi:hypothetical protein
MQLDVGFDLTRVTGVASAADLSFRVQLWGK